MNHRKRRDAPCWISKQHQVKRSTWFSLWGNFLFTSTFLLLLHFLSVSFAPPWTCSSGWRRKYPPGCGAFPLTQTGLMLWKPELIQITGFLGKFFKTHQTCFYFWFSWTEPVRGENDQMEIKLRAQRFHQEVLRMMFLLVNKLIFNFTCPERRV